MNTTDILELARSLKMPAFAEALEMQLADPRQMEQSFTDRLGSLIEAECLRRTTECTGYLIRNSPLVLADHVTILVWPRL